MGYSVGHAEALSDRGDTVAAVQIGGLRTVLNSPFEIQTGDLVQIFIPDVEMGFSMIMEGVRILNSISCRQLHSTWWILSVRYISKLPMTFNERTGTSEGTVSQVVRILVSV